tara:strand:- start:2947 stop:3087 length:141 start_codon:yes stop_codon:yes gene_type:complete
MPGNSWAQRKRDLKPRPTVQVEAVEPKKSKKEKKEQKEKTEVSQAD